MPGDIAIVAYNVEDSSDHHAFHTPDEISMVSFVRLPVGTSIDITDNGWEQSYPGYWGNREGIIRIRRVNQDLMPGEVFTFHGSGNRPEDFVVLPDSTNWEVEVLDSTHYFNLTKDDQVWILHNGEWDRGQAMDKATYSGYPLYGWSATGWAGDTGHGSHGTTEYSELYDHMECFYPHGMTLVYKAKYDGPKTIADRRTWINRIKNPANWVEKNTNSAYSNSTPKYIEGYTFNVDTSQSSLKGRWIGDHDNNWFDCSNWSDHTVPGKNTDVFLDHNTQNYAHIASGAPFSHLHRDTARCRNLNLLQDSIVLQGDSSLLEITENLEINGGHLTPHDAHIMIQGNWTGNTPFDFTPGSSTVTFNGSSRQRILNHSGPENFHKISIRNDSGAVMESPLQVNTLEFSFGHLFLEQYDLVVSGHILGAGPSGYCVTLDQPGTAGHLVMHAGTSPIAFPVGTSNYYSPATISTPDTSKEFKIRTFSNIRENGYSGSILGGNIVPISWAIEPVNPVDSAHITLQWEAAMETMGFSQNRVLGDMIQNPGDGDKTGWTDWNFLIHSSEPQGSDPYKIHTMNVTQFGVFSVSADRCVILKPDTSPIYYFAH